MQKHAFGILIACAFIIMAMTGTIVAQYYQIQGNKRALAQNLTVVEKYTAKYAEYQELARDCLTETSDMYVTWGLDKIYSDGDVTALLKYQLTGERIQKLQKRFLEDGSK